MSTQVATQTSIGRVLSATFLVAGTCIGGGMLALPVTAAAIGFFPAMVVMVLCCIFMTLTGLLFLEATLWMKKDAHVISMAGALLGRTGKVVCWITFLFICYASLVGYIDAGGKQIGYLTFTALFTVALFLGKSAVTRINGILFIAMLGAYFLLNGLGMGGVSTTLLSRQDWQTGSLLMMVPILLTTFSIPGIVPSLVPYLNRDIKAVKLAIVGGMVLTLSIYLVWQLVVIGSVPFEVLQAAYENGDVATVGLNATPLLATVASFFAFFAIATSFLGISLSLFDFLADGLKIEKDVKGRLVLSLLIAIPSLIGALWMKRAFLATMELTGGFGDALLSGLIPVLLVWVGRYRKKQTGEYTVLGGKPLLVLLGVISGGIFLVELISQLR